MFFSSYLKCEVIHSRFYFKPIFTVYIYRKEDCAWRNSRKHRSHVYYTSGIYICVESKSKTCEHPKKIGKFEFLVLLAIDNPFTTRRIRIIIPKSLRESDSAYFNATPTTGACRVILTIRSRSNPRQLTSFQITSCELLAVGNIMPYP